MKYDAQNLFSEYIDGLVNLRRTLGYDYNEGERLLYKFSQFCTESFPDETALTEEVVMAWSENPANYSKSYQQARMAVVRNLGLYMRSLGVSNTFVLPSELYPSLNSRYVPYIYSKEELTRLFKAADSYSVSFRTTHRHITAPVCFRMLYCCGLRPSEALNLLVENVDLENGILKILKSKGHKDRIVVMSDDLLLLCKKFNERMESLFPCRKFFFRSTRADKPYRLFSLQLIFNEMLVNAGINQNGINRPRIYDLRHTFATHCLHNWVISGEDVNSKLPYLSSYMGHDDVTSTAYYIHLLPKEFLEMSKISTKWYSDVTTEVCCEN